MDDHVSTVCIRNGHELAQKLKFILHEVKFVETTKQEHLANVQAVCGGA